jgi:hypothetical protein
MQLSWWFLDKLGKGSFLLSCCLLGAYVKLQKKNYWPRHACPSFRPHRITRLTLGGFS